MLCFIFILLALSRGYYLLLDKKINSFLKTNVCSDFQLSAYEKAFSFYYTIWVAKAQEYKSK
jgi:hypothetical protein